MNRCLCAFVLLPIAALEIELVLPTTPGEDRHIACCAHGPHIEPQLPTPSTVERGALAERTGTGLKGDILTTRVPAINE